MGYLYPNTPKEEIHEQTTPPCHPFPADMFRPPIGCNGTSRRSIPDANLRAAIENALGKAAGAPITADEIATLTQLEARNTNISDLTGLEHAHNLERLDFSGDWVSGTGLANSNEISNVSLLSGLTQLTWLDLGGNNISDISPLAELTNLTSLFLYDNSVSDISPVADLTKLTLLHLWGNSVSDISPVADLTKLTSLFLGGNSVSDISPVADLTKLTQLGLGGNNISDISPLVGRNQPNIAVSWGQLGIGHLTGGGLN